MSFDSGQLQPNPIVELMKNQCLSEAVTELEGLHCPRIFDGWKCWNATPAGRVVFSNCPDFIYGFEKHRLAHKVCNTDGTWFRHPESNITWSNYTLCVDTDDLLWQNNINQIYIIGYSVSVVALVFSMIIFFSFRALRCTRITIHKNLFLSFIINNGTWIIWYTTILKAEVLQENGIFCQLLHVFLQYFLVCNYFWMFCEGLYLFILLVVAFVNDEAIIKWFYLIGWVVPIIPTVIYAGTRGYFPEETHGCWTDYNSPYTWILSTTVCLSMVANLIFLIIIVYVLITKLKAVNSPDVNQTRKTVRATLILIPLLGLHYLVTPFRPSKGSPGEQVYEMISALVTSFQGLCVACLFCFFNGEVSAQVMRRLNQKRSLNNRNFSIAGTTVSECATTV